MDFRDIFLERTELVSIGAIPSVVRDAKDDYLIALSEVSEADYLVTGDSDLLVLEKSGRTRILTMAEFMQILGT